MTHSELCFETAKHFIKGKSKIALYEYKSFASMEEPDVLLYSMDETCLFEIKTSRSDFFADAKKECRKTVKQSYWVNIMNKERDPDIKKSYVKVVADFPEIFYKQFPHLGNERYFVCESGLLQPEELPEHWGLYWYYNGKFILKKYSDSFRSNLLVERNLAIHALRRYASGDSTGILINTY